MAPVDEELELLLIAWLGLQLGVESEAERSLFRGCEAAGAREQEVDQHGVPAGEYDLPAHRVVGGQREHLLPGPGGARWCDGAP